MLRIILALFMATVFHVLIILFPLQIHDVQPKPKGNNGIRVSLQTLSVPAAPLLKPVKKTPPIPEPQGVQKKVVSKPDPVQEEAIPEKIVKQIVLKPKTFKKKYTHIPKNRSAKPTLPSTISRTTAQQPVGRKKDNSGQLQMEPPPQIAIIKAAPLYHKNPNPEYPSLARRRNWQGTVILSVVVSAEGTVSDIQIHKSSNHDLLDKSALKTVRSWQFVPGKQNGKISEMSVLVPVHFKIDTL